MPLYLDHGYTQTKADIKHPEALASEIATTCLNNCNYHIAFGVPYWFFRPARWVGLSDVRPEPYVGKCEFLGFDDAARQDFKPIRSTPVEPDLSL